MIATGTAASKPVAADTSSQASTTRTAGDPAKGMALFNQNCTSCHGASLEGGIGPKLSPIAPLGGVKNPLDPAYLVATITNGRPPSDGFGQMPAKGGNNALTSTDVQDLAAYIISANHSGSSTYTPQELAVSTITWLTAGILGMLLLTWLLARYNMRWIARRAAARREGLGGDERPH